MFPPQKIEPQGGQESVWDYPRPPRLEPCNKGIKMEYLQLDNFYGGCITSDIVEPFKGDSGSWGWLKTLYPCHNYPK